MRAAAEREWEVVSLAYERVTEDFTATGLWFLLI
jgi:hypothetical protein